MDATPRERLHRLIDTLPTAELVAAQRYLEYLCHHGDPFVLALMKATETTEPLSDEDRQALDEGRRALDAGDLVSDRELRAELGI